MRNRSLAYSVVLLLLGCVLAGCGGGGSSDTEAMANAQTATQTVPAQIKVQPPSEDPEEAKKIQDLIRKLRGSDEREAYDAVLKLAMIADEASADALLSVVRTHRSESMRIAALRGLARMGDKRALGLVLRDLRSSDLTARRNAAGSLGNFKNNEEVIDPLIRALRDDDGWVRMNAQGSLEKITRQRHQTYDAWRNWNRSRQSSR